MKKSIIKWDKKLIIEEIIDSYDEQIYDEPTVEYDVVTTVGNESIKFDALVTHDDGTVNAVMFTDSPLELSQAMATHLNDRFNNDIIVDNYHPSGKCYFDGNIIDTCIKFECGAYMSTTKTVGQPQPLPTQTIDIDGVIFDKTSGLMPVYIGDEPDRAVNALFTTRTTGKVVDKSTLSSSIIQFPT